jgi:hypothetical protein
VAKITGALDRFTAVREEPVDRLGYLLARRYSLYFFNRPPRDDGQARRPRGSFARSDADVSRAAFLHVGESFGRAASLVDTTMHEQRECSDRGRLSGWSTIRQVAEGRRLCQIVECFFEPRPVEVVPMVRVYGAPGPSLVPTRPPEYIRLSVKSDAKWHSGPEFWVARPDNLPNRLDRQVRKRPPDSAKDAQSVAAGINLAPRAAVRCVGPSAIQFLPFKKQRRDSLHVLPIGSIIGLDDRETIGNQRSVNERQELRRQQPAMLLFRVAIGLRMIEVNLGAGDARRTESSS